MKKRHIYPSGTGADLRLPDAGIIDLGGEQKIMSVTLKPRFGYMEIFSLPEEDANVYINNELVGKTPYKSQACLTTRLPCEKSIEALFLQYFR